MEFLTAILESVVAGWGVITGIISPFVSLEVFVPSLLILLAIGTGYALTRSFLLDVLALFGMATCVYFILLSVNGIAENIALALAILALIVGLLASWGDANSKGLKIFDVLLILGFTGGFLYLLSGSFGIELIEPVRLFLEQTVVFANRTGDAVRGGAGLFTP